MIFGGSRLIILDGWKMNKILVTRSSMPPKEEYEKEISELWDTHWLTNMGVKHKQFQAELEAR